MGLLSMYLMMIAVLVCGSTAFFTTRLSKGKGLMQSRQSLALRLGVLSVAALLLPILVAEAQLHVPHQSKNGAPSSPPAVEIPTNATLDYTGRAWECKRGYRRSGNECVMIKMPAHALIDYTGHAWECEYGYQRSGNACVVVDVPAHAALDYFGHAWECERGYHQSGNACVVVDVPAHATLDYTGHGWECERGYQRSGTACVVVDVPAHATLDYTGHGWACEHGYHQSGQACVAVDVPAHATLDYIGHGWECETGYRRVGDACEKMTALSKMARDSAWAVPESGVPPQPPTDFQEEIRQIQQQLKQAGFDPGPVDGILGPQTIEALHRYLATRWQVRIP